MHLFWEKGFGSTSVADILARAGVNSGSLITSSRASRISRRGARHVMSTASGLLPRARVARNDGLIEKV